MPSLIPMAFRKRSSRGLAKQDLLFIKFNTPKHHLERKKRKHKLPPVYYHSHKVFTMASTCNSSNTISFPKQIWYYTKKQYAKRQITRKLRSLSDKGRNNIGPVHKVEEWSAGVLELLDRRCGWRMVRCEWTEIQSSDYLLTLLSLTFITLLSDYIHLSRVTF